MRKISMFYVRLQGTCSNCETVDSVRRDEPLMLLKASCMVLEGDFRGIALILHIHVNSLGNETKSSESISRTFYSSRKVPTVNTNFTGNHLVSSILSVLPLGLRLYGFGQWGLLQSYQLPGRRLQPNPSTYGVELFQGTTGVSGGVSSSTFAVSVIHWIPLGGAVLDNDLPFFFNSARAPRPSPINVWCVVISWPNSKHSHANFSPNPIVTNQAMRSAVNVRYADCA